MFLGPQPIVTEPDLRRGLKALMWDAAFATAVGALNSGVVLAAYALHLGASNAVIGVLAALPFWTQILQAPAVALVERLRARRLISVVCVFVARLALPVMAVLAFLPNRPLALVILVAAEGVHCAFNAVGACSWNSWIRDLVPEERLGRFFARRSTYAAVIGMTGSLLAGVALDRGGEHSGLVFAALYGLGFLASLVSTAQLARVPEPVMEGEQPMHLLRLLRLPLRDVNFRRLIVFLSSWQFAVNIATPFFTVYFLRQLGFGVTFVLALSVVSQIANLMVLRGWGRLSDRFSNKSVLSVAAPAFIACIAAMAGASQIEGRVAAGAYLVGLHVVMGMASAGVGLASGNIAMKLAPRGAATVYIATNSLVTSAAAGAAPLLGGLFADFFAARELTVSVLWKNPSGIYPLLPLQFTNWDFYFLIAAAFGLYALHRLTLVREEGTVENRLMVQEVLLEARRAVVNLSPVAGLRQAIAFPAASMVGLPHLRRLRRAERLRGGPPLPGGGEGGAHGAAMGG